MNSKKQEINWKLIGASEHINYLRREIEYIAKKIETLDMAVLISGPSGTGKELIAKAIAEQSGLKLVTINCGAIPRELFESELFGYVPGAFTGALKKGKKGFVEAAKGGILFLDEIGDLTLENQGKVLRLLQERSYYKVGSEQEEKAEDLKILAATNRILTKEIIEKRFREDLWYRLKHRNVKTIPLKDRRVDIICLVNHFVHETKVKIDPKVKMLLYSYDFPGNVRELESLIYSSDDFEYVKTALKNNIASTIGIDVEVISKYNSLNDFDNAISMEDMLDMTHEWRRKERYEEDLSWRESLLRNTDADEFFSATFFAEENECSKMVEAYEIMTLKLCEGLSRDKIRQLLHSDTLILSPNGFKEAFGFDFSIKDDMWNYTEPLKLYPSFSTYWANILRSKEPNP
jgi:transcriptional regulator with PAS, ATPase and Fis domain